MSKRPIVAQSFITQNSEIAKRPVGLTGVAELSNDVFDPFYDKGDFSMSVVARIKSASGVVDAGPISTTNSGWSDFKNAILAFENISELQKLIEQGNAEDGLALRDDLEAVLATFELSEDSTLIAQALLKIAVGMEPGDVLTVAD
ncbi:MAG: hypothetical protein WCH39_20160 [Schlesneria sp.]